MSVVQLVGHLKQSRVSTPGLFKLKTTVSKMLDLGLMSKTQYEGWLSFIDTEGKPTKRMEDLFKLLPSQAVELRILEPHPNQALMTATQNKLRYR